MAGLIAPSTIEQIRAANDIVDVIGSYFPLKRAGANFVALCPFHKEKTPSFNINPHRQIFHCFGCHKGGDVFTFVREYENLTFSEAAKRLAERANIPLEFENQPGQKQARHLKEQLLEIHDQITRRWQSALTNDASGQVARNYLAKRGVTSDAIALFRLGYAPEAWDDTVNWAKSKGYDLEVVEKSGLILRKEGSDRFYDRFRGRLIFPIADEQGRIIGFSGRLLAADAKAAKYVNSPETVIFHKSKVFFGLDKAKRPILDAESAIICEGQLDLIACHQSGIQNVVAPQGTAFTADHARILKRYVEEVILCFDSDSAGQTAAVRSLDDLLAAGFAIRVVSLPAPHDPDSFIKQFGAQAFRELISKAPGFFDFYLERLCAVNDPKTDRGRISILKEMAESVYKTGNQVLIDTYAQKTAQRLGVATEAVRLEFRKLYRSSSFSRTTAEDPVTADSDPDIPRPSAPEQWLLKIIFIHEELVEWVAAHLDLQWVRHPLVRIILAARLEAFTHQTWQGLPAFLDKLESPTARQLLTEAASEKRGIPEPELALKGDMTRKGIVETMRNDFLDQQLVDLQRKARQSNLSDAEIAGIESQKMELRQLKRQSLQPLTGG